MDKSKIGLIGLAVMGQNLARNIASHNFKISVYNRTSSVTEAFLDEHGNDFLVGQKELADFVDSLEKPRKVGIMVKAGKPVDMVIESLLPLLEAGDTIIDLGNSHFPDTIRREAALKAQGIHFFGCGVSGGEEGALKGPSMMPGGDKAIYHELEPILSAIAAKDFNGQPCVTYLGTDGAGHYVKMIHNGIEYGVMQMMAEAYEILSQAFGLSASEIGDIFETYSKGKLESFLFDISVPILRKKDDLAEGYLIDNILDKAGQKGTGRWTAIEGLDRGTALSVITQSVYARTTSSHKDQRVKLASAYSKPPVILEVDMNDFIRQLEDALYAGMLVSYAQGFDLLRQAALDQNWPLDYREIARIWQGGCIIRARILSTLCEAFSAHNNAPLWDIPTIQEDLEASWAHFREVVALGAKVGTPMFALGAALASLEAMTNATTSANFIQAQRDSFGAHTYQRIDREGTFHTQWD